MPSGGAPDASKGSRSTGTRPSRAAVSSRSTGTSATNASASSRDHRTAPPVETIEGASVTASTAAKPTPKRPTDPSSSRFADARATAIDSTPAASSGAPVLAAVSVVPARSSTTRPGTPARVAASAAFCASSTTTRSR